MNVLENLPVRYLIRRTPDRNNPQVFRKHADSHGRDGFHKKPSTKQWANSAKAGDAKLPGYRAGGSVILSAHASGAASPTCANRVG